MSALRASMLLEALTVLAHLRRPAMVIGDPGIGKSDVMAQLAQRLGLRLQDERLATMESVDVRGLPAIVDGRTVWARPEFLPTESDPPTLLFLDEFMCAPASVQNACLQLLLNRRIGPHVLPSSCVIMAAGNPASSGAHVSRMSTATAFRMTWLSMEANLDDWASWAAVNGISSALVGFLRWKPGLLVEQPKAGDTSRANPRSWAFASPVVEQFLAGQIGKGTMHAIVTGMVGEGAATECFAFLDLYKTLPDRALIIAKSDTAPVPQDPSARYAVAYALAQMADKTNLAAILAYMDRLPVEYNVLAVRAAARRDPSLCAHPAFIKWALKHDSALSTD